MVGGVPSLDGWCFFQQPRLTSLGLALENTSTAHQPPSSKVR